VGGEPAEDRYVAGLAPGQRARYSALLNGSTSAVGTFTLPSGAVVGYETGGCLGAARQALFGSVRVQALDDLYPQDVEHRFATFRASNGAYESALRSWRSCMAAAGWRLASPQAAIQAIQALAAKPGTSQSELTSRQTRAATADAACNARSGLRARVADALAVFVRKLPGAEVLQLQRIYLSRRRAASVAVRDLPT
jgi:hypothetical protein